MELGELVSDLLPGEFDRIIYANQTYLRTELSQGTPGPFFRMAESPEQDVVTMITHLEQCTPIEEVNQCSFATEGLTRHAKWSSTNGWTRIDFFQYKTDSESPFEVYPYTYFSFELKEAVGPLEFRYLMVGPTQGSLLDYENRLYLVVDGQGNWEQISLNSYGRRLEPISSSNRYDHGSLLSTRLHYRFSHRLS
ncbi:MAG: hypothetical protein MZU97_25515 [Bacillus subtilis]|nr:hypothetical protein [Bacillus subtilis]